MEFLLINHPLDCPICDQGGECDLQDQAMAYGIDTTRYHENKRAVPDKYIGPLVATKMNRCIHCTRCIRFATEVAGVADLGAIGRGEDMEITTYLETAMRSELQGNVADLCPVGALDHKPQNYNMRPWELTKTESVDVMDAVGSAIRVDARGREVMRIVPRINEAINEEWISDKTRQVVDGLRTAAPRPALHPRRRAPAPRLLAGGLRGDRRAGEGGRRQSASARIAGDLAAVEEIFALKLLMASLGSPNLDCRQDGSAAASALRARLLPLQPDDRRHRERRRNPDRRREPARRGLAPQCRASASAGASAPLPIGLIGEPADLTYDSEYLGAGPETLSEVVAGRHGFADKLKAAKRPLIIVGQGALSRARRRCRPRARGAGRPDLRRRDRRAGTALASSTPLPPESARSISASCRGRAGSTPPRWPAAARSRSSTISAPTRSTSRRAPS